MSWFKFGSKNKDVKVEETSLKEFNFDIQDLIFCLGGKENIKVVKQGINRIGVDVVDKTKVDIEGIKKLGANSVFVVQNNISLLFGDSFVTICKALQKAIA